jgi:DNA-nicking Smr family endonuclease
MRRHRSQKEKHDKLEVSFKNQAFRGLRNVELKKPQTSRPAPVRQPVEVVAPVKAEDSAESLFQAAMSGVAPLDEQRRQRVATPLPASPAREVTHPDAEALAELCDLVAGSAPFDISDSDEYVEGLVAGVDPRLVGRLRRGEFAYQAHLDLHGMTSDEARVAVEGFLTAAFQNGKRCVLIIHGRGRNSMDQIPVLKTRLTGWLARGQWSRLVLAFTSARPCDGGVGAVYVLLRRRHDRKRRIKVVNGAKH